MSGAGPMSAPLESELERLKKINAALIERAESSEAAQATDFGIFQATVLLEDQVRSRTEALDQALRQLEEANRALRESRAELRAIFDLMPNPVAISLPADGTLIGVSRSFSEFFGLDPDAMIGRRTSPSDLGLWSSDEERECFLARVEADRQGRTVDFPLEYRRPDGSIVNLVISGRILETEGRRLLLTEYHDVTEATRSARYLRNLAEHDVLTGLPNRLLLLDRLQQAMATARRGGLQLAVCYLDLDGFKTVNDRFGHQAGDFVLIETAHRLLGVVRASDTVARMGGDEFAMLLPGITARIECEVILQRALREIAQPYTGAGFDVSVGVSAGYTLYPDDDSGPESLLEHADQALYLAKQAGKNRYAWFGAR
ncbi:MAG: sensor domain-containing diguanylate cyclase [Methylococcaceae bacterium]|nr:sensor domain-containing diguanylate cyclase [Methylococcaceae bacterium]